METTPKLTLYVDTVSPFAYLAYYITRYFFITVNSDKYGDTVIRNSQPLPCIDWGFGLNLVSGRELIDGMEQHDPAFSKCDVEYVPMFLGGVMKACGNTPPINIKNKDKWINTERVRWARFFGIPMTAHMPDGFPPLTLTIMRALCAVTVLEPGQEALVACLDALFAAYWVRCEETTERG
ncbi:hypothetical protein LARI1_G005029, partial [Lachnellula arida]